MALLSFNLSFFLISRMALLSFALPSPTLRKRCQKSYQVSGKMIPDFLISMMALLSLACQSLYLRKRCQKSYHPVQVPDLGPG